MPKAPALPVLSPRKRPGQKRSAHTVEAILEAAARILETQGLIACTTNAVAAKAGVSIGSLYQYFPNRDALTVALIERETEQLVNDIERATHHTTARQRITGMVQAAVAHQLRRPDLARVIDFEERRLPVDERHQRVATVIQTALVEALSLPDVQPPVIEIGVVAEDVLAIVRGMIDAAGERGEVDALSLERRVMRAVLGYVEVL